MSGSGNQPLPAKEQQLFRCAATGGAGMVWRPRGRSRVERGLERGGRGIERTGCQPSAALRASEPRRCARDGRRRDQALKPLWQLHLRRTCHGLRVSRRSRLQLARAPGFCAPASGLRARTPARPDVAARLLPNSARPSRALRAVAAAAAALRHKGRDPSGRRRQRPGLARPSRSVVKFYESKQYKKAVKSADQILKKFPDHGETLAMKVRAPAARQREAAEGRPRLRGARLRAARASRLTPQPRSSF
jgi:hypothetical protein